MLIITKILKQLKANNETDTKTPKKTRSRSHLSSWLTIDLLSVNVYASLVAPATGQKMFFS